MHEYPVFTNKNDLLKKHKSCIGKLSLTVIVDFLQQTDRSVMKDIYMGPLPSSCATDRTIVSLCYSCTRFVQNQK